MEAASLEQLLHRDPFIPFRLKLSNGEVVDIVNPSLVVVMRREVFVADPSRDHWHIYSLWHIVGLDVAEAA